MRLQLVLEDRLTLNGRRFLARCSVIRSGLVMMRMTRVMTWSLRFLRPPFRPRVRRRGGHRGGLQSVDIVLGRWFGMRPLLQGPADTMRVWFHRSGRTAAVAVRSRDVMEIRFRSARRCRREAQEGSRRQSDGLVPGWLR